MHHRGLDNSCTRNEHRFVLVCGVEGDPEAASNFPPPFTPNNAGPKLCATCDRFSPLSAGPSLQLQVLLGRRPVTYP